MEIIQAFLVIMVFSGFVAILLMVYYNRFEELIVYINEAEMNIDECLRKKFDLLSRMINVINGNIEDVDNTFEDFVKLKGRKLTNYDMDRKLVDCSIAFYEISDKHKELKNIKNYMKMIKELEENEEKLIAAKGYYNDSITSYNRLVRMFPSNLVAIFTKKSEKPFFDGKNMYDLVYNDFQV